jgi:3-dehydroquinate synthase
MIIKSNLKEYCVNIYTDIEKAKNIDIDSNTFVVVDKKLFEIYNKESLSSVDPQKIYLLDAKEENKTIDTALEICEIMTKIPAKRNVKLISFGGGIVQDITGFVANILYRGIHWTFYPTTLLAACDSCIGGKTSLNYKSFKNLLGTFYPPDEINICIPFFNTLTEKDFQSGLGEIVKFNIMFGEQGIVKMENNIDLLLNRDCDKIKDFVENSLEFKKKFIEKDEFDKGVRINLNFAHTFGHAFETVSKYAIPHGTAVAMGTIVANRVSYMRGWLKEDIILRIENILLKIINIDLVCDMLNMDAILEAIHKDKKQIGKQLTAVLMKDNMELQVVHDVDKYEIETAIKYLFTILN